MPDIRTKHQREHGFTLIEMLVVAPMVILLIGVSIAYITTLTGKSLQVQAKETIIYGIQNALNTIEDDAVKATQFNQTTGALPSPQGQDDTTAAFTSNSGNTLIMGLIATTTNPVQMNRQPIVYADQPNACSSDDKINNTVFTTQAVYFVKNGSLWRRMIVPTYNTNSPSDSNTVCDTPWQRNSCAPGKSGTACKTEDEEVLQNVTSFSIAYYESASSTDTLSAADAPQARTISVSITAGQSIAGKTISQTGSISVTRQNDIQS